MARFYYEKAYHFKAQTDIPFEYVCGHCGKSVDGTRSVTMEYEYKKTAGKQEDLVLSDYERRAGEAKVHENLRKEIELFESQAKKGNYDFLRDQKECPFCHQQQGWAYRSKKGLLQTLIGSAALIIGVILAILCLTSIGFVAEDGTPNFIPVIICVAGGALTVIAGLIELKKVKTLSGQKKQLPCIHFPDIA